MVPNRGIFSVHSHLFRRETARRLRVIAGDVVDVYYGHRAPWFNTYSRPDRPAILLAIEMLAQAVEQGRSMQYHQYSEWQIDTYLADGMPPIVLLAASDLLFQTIGWFLTQDQQELVDPILNEVRIRLQQTVQDCLRRRLEPVGA